jgi:hypothetical protein
MSDYNTQAFHGSYHKGAMKIIRQRKREEAETRNAQTPIERTKAYRRLVKVIPGE